MTRITGHTIHPHKLLDTLLERGSLKNDAALARELNVAPPVISKIRHHLLPVGPTHILAIHEKFAIPVKEIREALA
jgi:hypothetical protein